MICRYELIQKRTENFDNKKAYKFIDYFPNVFEQIRVKFKITREQYLRSIGPE